MNLRKTNKENEKENEFSSHPCLFNLNYGGKILAMVFNSYVAKWNTLLCLQGSLACAFGRLSWTA